MDWENTRIEQKLERLGQPPKQFGRLSSVEGGRIDANRTVGGSLVGRLLALLKRKPSGLRVVRDGD